MFKRLLLVGLILGLLVGIAGCAGNKASETTGNSVQSSAAPNAAFQDAQAKLLTSLQPLPAKPSKNYRIAALEITLANPFWVTVQQGYEDAAKEYGVTVDVLAAPNESDANGQLEDLETIVNKNYDAIAISPIDPLNLVPGVADATKKGIPVVAVGTDVDTQAAAKAGAVIKAFITSNFEDQGKLGAQFIVNKIGSGKVAIIAGLAGAAQSEARKKGAQETFAANPNIKIVSVQNGDWDRQKAYNIAADLIQANPDLKGIYCANDDMALGVVQALKAAGKKNQVVVTGNDFIDEARKSIENGELDATVAMSPYLFGKGGLILALKVIEGQQVNQAIYWSPVALIDKDNVNTFDGWR